MSTSDRAQPPPPTSPVTTETRRKLQNHRDAAPPFSLHHLLRSRIHQSTSSSTTTNPHLVSRIQPPPSFSPFTLCTIAPAPFPQSPPQIEAATNLQHFAGTNSHAPATTLSFAAATITFSVVKGGTNPKEGERNLIWKS
ncbi:hypothetical protein DEO72_LG3g2028 [Vigna unguiculata]|uniref:Uncharacterized protein n=1 Tax=Vigna unguiculata TaxID=3917 RepID=A0A4D6LFS9_VIGUN|nr:hypothetical protein DEO72_LG3g2028 [Vigna unguiculata]